MSIFRHGQRQLNDQQMIFDKQPIVSRKRLVSELLSQLRAGITKLFKNVWISGHNSKLTTNLRESTQRGEDALSATTYPAVHL